MVVMCFTKNCVCSFLVLLIVLAVILIDIGFVLFVDGPGGGGASDIRIGGTGLDDRVIVAAGGGGAGGSRDR